MPLPDALNPINKILSLAVADVNTQSVMSADLTNPDSLQYLVKRGMHNDGVENSAAAGLRIHATKNFVQFGLRASGLTPSASYFLAINNAQPYTDLTTDTSGNASVNALPVGAPDILDITNLAILNSSSNSVLSTTLP